LLIDHPSIFHLPSARSRPSFALTQRGGAILLPIDRQSISWLSVTRCHHHCRLDIAIPGTISNKCWMTRDLLVVQKISLLEIVSTAAVLLAMVVESSRAFHVVG